jgi:hypothetical protein
MTAGHPRSRTSATTGVTAAIAAGSTARRRSSPRKVSKSCRFKTTIRNKTVENSKKSKTIQKVFFLVTGPAKLALRNDYGSILLCFISPYGDKNIQTVLPSLRPIDSLSLPRHLIWPGCGAPTFGTLDCRRIWHMDWGILK